MMFKLIEKKLIKKNVPRFCDRPCFHSTPHEHPTKNDVRYSLFDSQFRTWFLKQNPQLRISFATGEYVDFEVKALESVKKKINMSRAKEIICWGGEREKEKETPRKYSPPLICAWTWSIWPPPENPICKGSFWGEKTLISKGVTNPLSAVGRVPYKGSPCRMGATTSAWRPEHEIGRPHADQGGPHHPHFEPLNMLHTTRKIQRCLVGVLPSCKQTALGTGQFVYYLAHIRAGAIFISPIQGFRDTGGGGVGGRLA